MQLATVGQARSPPAPIWVNRGGLVTFQALSGILETVWWRGGSGPPPVGEVNKCTTPLLPQYATMRGPHVPIQRADAAPRKGVVHPYQCDME